MNFFDFMWDSSQDSKIAELEKRIETLEQENKILWQWVNYFKTIEENRNDSTSSST